MRRLVSILLLLIYFLKKKKDQREVLKSSVCFPPSMKSFEIFSILFFWWGFCLFCWARTIYVPVARREKLIRDWLRFSSLYHSCNIFFFWKTPGGPGTFCVTLLEGFIFYFSGGGIALPLVTSVDPLRKSSPSC